MARVYLRGTFLPLVILPDVAWLRPFVPTMEGRYIIKILVLIGAGLHLGGRVGGVRAAAVEARRRLNPRARTRP